MQNDFPSGIVNVTAHRPWPLPQTPWLMTQSWHNLLFAHWPVDAAQLRSHLPPGLPLDLYEGQAWLGIVAFDMSNVAPRFVPALPWLSAFPEINVRTYVRVDDKPGVYFFSLDATNPVAVQVARWVFHLPYHTAAIEVRRNGDAVGYNCRRRAAGGTFEAIYRPVGAAAEAAAGSLEYFLTERYCLYTMTRSGEPRRLEIHHKPWPLQTADAQIAVNTMARAAGITLPAVAPLVHFAKRMDVVTWGMQSTT